ncbi:hypothetical protein BH20ACT6_BH20ACT6_06880 [soil metagenome]
MTTDWAERVGAALGAEVLDDFGVARVDIAAAGWLDAVRTAREELGCTFFDWLTGVDELHDGYRLVCHLAVPPVDGARIRTLIIRALVPRDEPAVASVSGVFAGAGWHEREVAEMFGVRFTDGDRSGPGERLLLSADFDGHPLRKDFVLASRVAEPWPGAKEPGESDASLAGQEAEQADAGAPARRSTRRRSRPAGVPEPDEWGPRAPGSPDPDPLAAVTDRRPRRGGSR